jgi:deoxyribodipyrimidine photo-lyase
MEPRSRLPAQRLSLANGAATNPSGDYVLYWMIANRRSGWNWALERAVEWARHLGKPLVVLEALRCDYPWASDRLHAFLLQGMAGNARAFAARHVTYLPIVEGERGAGRGLLAALAARACLVVTDEAPVFFLPRMVAAAASRLPVRCEKVDSYGLLPLAATDAVLPTAYAFRRLLQRLLPRHLETLPRPDPLAGAPLPSLAELPPGVAARWPSASPAVLAAHATALAPLPIDHTVPMVTDTPGGSEAGAWVLERFLTQRLARYAWARNHPDEDAPSGLSPYLHFGHVSVHQVLEALAGQEGWSTERLSGKADGKKAGWWGMSEGAEAFLDELVTWRELAANLAAKRDDGEAYESLPPWARATLEAHAGDPRPALYTPEQLAAAATHDPLWNAAQRQLLTEGTIHGYLRMLWGKKILEWSPTPEDALAVMFELNHRYALDGRDPNSAAGIMWCLGRYDRPWGPERPVFGTVRYMSSANTRRKLRLTAYLERFGR